MKFKMITGRTIRQGEFVEHKLSEQYLKETSSCHINPVDMMIMSVREGDRIYLQSISGGVVMTAKEDNCLKRGTVFVPYGPYCNIIIQENSHGTGMPDFKSSTVAISPTDKKILSLYELLKKSGGRQL